VQTSIVTLFDGFTDNTADILQIALVSGAWKNTQAMSNMSTSIIHSLIQVIRKSTIHPLMIHNQYLPKQTNFTVR